MTNEQLICKIKKCDLNECQELIPGSAYYYKQKKLQIIENMWCEYEEMIILVKEGLKVGGIYRMGYNDLHWIIIKKYQNQHILSNFLKTEIMQKLWPENKSVKLYDIISFEDYKKKCHLVRLCNMNIKNKDELEAKYNYFQN